MKIEISGESWEVESIRQTVYGETVLILQNGVKHIALKQFAFWRDDGDFSENPDWEECNE